MSDEIPRIPAAEGLGAPMLLPDPEKESAQTFTSKAEARAYVRNVVAEMIRNEIAVYGRSAEGWFHGEIHDARTRELITEAAYELARKLAG